MHEQNTIHSMQTDLTTLPPCENLLEFNTKDDIIDVFNVDDGLQKITSADGTQPTATTNER